MALSVYILRVFISGKECELDDERAMARKVVEDFHLCPIDSKARGASDQSVRQEYLDEVRLSDIHVGIFALKDSPPSREEFEIARAQKLPTLVFVKQLHNKETRDPELESFLTAIKDSRAGVTIEEYNEVIDFQTKLTSSLSKLLSREFRRGRECAEKTFELEAELQQYKKPSEEVPLEVTPMPAFTSIKIPDKVEIGKPSNVSATVVGSSTNAFVDLKIVTPDDKVKYYPDPRSWDSKRDYGTLNLKPDKPYQNEWSFIISSKNKPGKYKAYIQLYEDMGEPPNKERKLVASEERDIEVK